MKRTVLAFLAVSLIWRSTYLGIRVALEAYPPFLVAAARFLVAGAALYAVGRARGEAAPTRSEWASVLLTGTLFFVLGNGLVNVAEKYVSSGVAAVFVSTVPLWMTIFATLSGERATRRELAGVALGLVGVAVMNLGGDLRASRLGLACAMLAPLAWAAGSVASKRLPLPGGLVTRTGSQMLAGGAANLLVAGATGERLPEVHSARALLAVAYLSVFGSLIAFTAYSYLLRNASASVATSYAYVNPVIAVALGVVLAGERIGVMTAAGGLVVLGAVALVVRGRTAPEATTPAAGSRDTSLPIERTQDSPRRAPPAPLALEEPTVRNTATPLPLLAVALAAAVSCSSGDPGPDSGIAAGSSGVPASSSGSAGSSAASGDGGPPSGSDGGASVDGVPAGDFAAMNAWLQRKEYLAWPKESAPRAFTPGGGGHSGTVRTYLSPKLDASMKAGGAEHPRGAASVKELYQGGVVAGWAVSLKTEDASNGGNGWYWYEINDTKPSSGGIGGQGSSICIGCHSSGKDFVRVAYPLP